MENHDLKTSKKYFSGLGLRLFLGMLVITAVQLISSVIAEMFTSVDGNLAFLVVMLPMYIIAYPIIFLLLKALPSRQYGEEKSMSPGQWFAAFFMAYAGMYICNIIGTIITSIIGIIKQGTVSNVMLEVTGSIHPAVNFLIIVICAPIMEELLFRKVLIDKTAQFGEGVAVVLSGLLFGLFHGNLNQFAYAFFLGAFFAFIYVKTKNIVYPITLHMVINFMGSFVSTLMLKAVDYNKIMEATTNGATEAELTAIMMENIPGLLLFGLYIVCLVLFLITGLVLWVLNRSRLTLNDGEIMIEKGERFKTIFCNAGMGLYCIFWIITIIIQLFS